MMEPEMRVDPTVHAAAFIADEAEAKRLCQETQNLWDSGHCFRTDAGLYRMFGLDPRETDSQEELDAAIKFLETQLAALAIRNTIAQMSREECAVLVRALDHLDLCARVTVFGQELSAAGIRLQWNNLHQDEQPILPTPGIAPEI